MWSWYASKACFFSGNDGDAILQVTPQVAGNPYLLKFTISGMTQGKLQITNYDHSMEFTESGTYVVLVEPLNSTLAFRATADGSDLFYGCIDNVEEYPLGAFSPMVSQCINLQEDQGGLMLIEASCNSNNLNFAWSGLTLSMRIKAKLAKVAYKTQREPNIDSAGEEQIIYFDGHRSRFLQVDAAPIWTHDFLYLCMAADTLNIDSVSYVIDEEEYPDIKWNKSFKEGTVEMKIKPRVNKLNKTNCG
jgi:hypothetical protein